MKELLLVDRLTKKFGELVAVDELSFEVKEGEILGMMGPNGAGKTTIFNLIAGTLEPTKGRIFFKEKCIDRYPPWKRCHLGIGRTYQIPKPFEKMTVFENVLVGAVHGANLLGRKAKEKAEKILKLTGLFSKKDLLAGTLSLLDRKRLELARALSTDPSLLLIDEVAAGLTEIEGEEVLKIVKKIRDEGITVIWVEHVLKMMLEGVDRLLVICKGQKLCCGCLEEVLNTKEVQEAYLGVEEEGAG